MSGGNGAAPKGAIFSFFSGLGILDLGFERAGFRCWMANEVHPPFARAYRYARDRSGDAQPVSGVVEGSVSAFLSGDGRARLLSEMRAARDACGVVGFVGGPPCPDFSVGGKQAGRHGERGRLTEEYADLICAARPDFFLFENVRGLVSTARHRAFFEEIKARLSAAGWRLTERLANAIWYGAPQDRWRIILVGFRDDAFPAGAASRMAETFDWDSRARWRDALAAPWPTQRPPTGEDVPWPAGLDPALEPLTAQWWFDRNRVSEHPDAGRFLKPKSPRLPTVAEGDVSRKSFKRLHRWRYSPTVAYGNNEVHLHPREPRRLTAAEAMALQTVPRRFVLPPEMTLTDMFKSVGNGVPYLLSRAVANAVAAALAAHGAGGAAAASARA